MLTLELPVVYAGEVKLPERLGRYKILRLLGSGGMGRVYVGQHQDTGWIRALKTLRLEEGEYEANKRFIREAKATAEIAHPNVVKIYEFSYDDDEGYYFVMEYLEGEDLDARLERFGPLPWRELRGWMLQAARGLGSAHERGILHRDVKPSNLFVTRTDDGPMLKIIDFGIAKITRGSILTVPNTVTESVIGTPYYVSPEQIMMGEVDARSDIYSLGATFYHLLVGEPPFGGLIHKLLQAHLERRPEPPRKANPGAMIPEEVQAIILKCLEKRPGARYQTAKEMETALLAVPQLDVTLPALEAPAPGRRGMRWIKRGALGALLVACMALFSLAISTQREAVADADVRGGRPGVQMEGSNTTEPPSIPPAKLGAPEETDPGTDARAADERLLVPVPDAAPSDLPEAPLAPVKEVVETSRRIPPSCSAAAWKYVKKRIADGYRRAGLATPKSLEITYKRHPTGTVTGSRSARAKQITSGSKLDGKLDEIVRQAFRGCVEATGPVSDTVVLRWSP